MHTVAKLIDTTTCIGCKACEVACQEWNDQQFTIGTFDGTYQTLPDLEHNFWNLIKFNEFEREDGELTWNMVKYQCMHCIDPGCLKACPAPGAIFRQEDGIVDFDHNKCIGCGYCITGCPFDVPRLSPKTKQGLQVFALFGPYSRRARTGVHQGLSDELPELRYTRRLDPDRKRSGDRIAGGRARSSRCLQPGRCRRDSRTLRVARRLGSGKLRSPERSENSVDGHSLERPVEVAGQLSSCRWDFGNILPLPAVWAADL